MSSSPPVSACVSCTAECAALRAALAEERANFEVLRTRLAVDRAAANRRVCLNVGGTRYETTVATLAKYEDSYFGALFSGRFELKTEDDGAIFLDRNGGLFGMILEFLRTGIARMPDTASEALPLLTELRYYLLEERYLAACNMPWGVPTISQRASKASASGRTASADADHDEPGGGLRSLAERGLGFVGQSDYTRKEIQEKRERDVTMFAAYRLDGIDLSDLDLSRCTLARSRLRNADLRRTELLGANLAGAQLCGTTMQGAVLQHASLREADLTGVDLSNAQCQGVDFEGACLTRVILRGTRLAGAVMPSVDLSGRDLVLAVLTDASLPAANLRGADMRGCNLRGANLNHADLSNANLQDADLTSAKLLNSILHNADLRGTGLRDASWELQGASLTGALLGNVPGVARGDDDDVSSSSGPPSPRAS